LRFSWFGHLRLRADAAEGDTALVSYFPQPDPDDSLLDQSHAARDAAA
jgi:hypothetical protein